VGFLHRLRQRARGEGRDGSDIDIHAEFVLGSGGIDVGYRERLAPMGIDFFLWPAVPRSRAP